MPAGARLARIVARRLARFVTGEFHRSCMSPTAANVKRNGGVSAGPHSASGREVGGEFFGCGPGACTGMEWNRSLRSESCIGLRKLSARKIA